MHESDNISVHEQRSAARSHDRRQLVFARNKLRLAARQIDLALERDGIERGLRAGFAFATATEGMRELGRAERRLNRGR